MRQTTWSNGQAITVYVLPNQHQTHQAFSTKVLGMFPYQLDRIWNKLVFSGLGEEQKKNLLGSNASGKLKHDFDTQFSVYWRPKLSKFQFGFSLLDADFSYQRGDNDTLFTGDETSQRIMFNLLYQGQYWDIWAMQLMYWF